ncbi:hypothetical protein [Streptomyces sp. NPDC088812]|uniref:hypothetical protein n=1 Tax=Streptomyces sp. NPDC088812 TaxID=3365905 RepID=UPI00382C9CD4
MTHDHHEPFDTAAAGVTLAAEAAVLEARAHLLREAIDTVDARMRETSEKLCRLRLSCPAPAAEEAQRQDGGDRRADLPFPGEHLRTARYVRGDEYASAQDVRGDRAGVRTTRHHR